MKRTGKRIAALLLTAAFVFALLPTFIIASYAEPTVAPAVSLGGATLTGTQYHYSNAAVAGTEIRTILISFTKTPTTGDKITAPTDVTGFTVSSSSLGNNYAKRINIASGKTAGEVQSYLRSVSFEVASENQSLSVSVTTVDIQFDTYYNSVNQHYYQFVPLVAGQTWIDAYHAALAKTYMGRAGYLATVADVQEDQFMLSVSGNVGWLGGTRMTYVPGTPDGFDNATNVGYWYWASGPEKGNHFYTVARNDSSADATTNDSTSAGAPNSYYFNWNRAGTSEPNGSLAADGENCLTTLFMGTGYAGTSGYSWNDVSYTSNYYTSAGDYNPKGYIVEYGGMAGDSTGDSDGSTYATTTGTLYEIGSISLGTVSWTSASSYTCGISLPASAKMVSLSVDSGFFTIPSLGSALTFIGGTTGADYTTSYSSSTEYGSAVMTFTDVSAVAALLSGIVYHPSGTTSQVITAASSAIPVQGSDLYFGGHFYRYINGAITWANAVKSAGATTDPYFCGRGYVATVTSNAENRVLLKLIETSSTSWHSAWLGGLWQRNEGTWNSPSIGRGINGCEIRYSDIVSAVTAGASSAAALLPRYKDSGFGFVAETPSTYIYNHPSDVLYYWIDGPEAGQEIQNNTAAFSPWHSGEPNGGDFVYVGFGGAYWDDSAGDTACSSMCEGYIVEFSGFDGGSSDGIIKAASKAVTFTEISSAAVTGIAAPESGGTPDTTASCATTGISTVSAVSWSPSAATTFDSGVAYTASVTLTAVNGYKFASPAATVNGSSAVVSGVSASQITVSYTFPSTAVYIYIPSGNVPVIIDGKEYSIGTAKTETDAGTGRQTTVVTLDDTAFGNQLESASERVIIPIPETAGISAQRSVLTADMVDRASEKDIPIEIRTNDVSYIISAGAVPTAELAASLGAPSDSLDDIEIDVNLTACSAAQLGVVENADAAGTWSLLMPPTAFSVTASYNGKTVDVDLFDCYVERVLEIPDGVDPSKITTALVVADSGSTRHVPTDVYRGTDGKWYARISSVTNSVYALMYNEAGFADAAGKWYENVVSEMAGRMILNGRSASVFDGDSSITRAEFASVLVRALGLPEDGKASFSDVSSSDWYYGAVGKAYEYKIISGRDGGVFDPNAAITREEAMVMIRRAAAVAEFTGTDVSLSANYTDLSKVSSWAASAAEFSLANGLIKGSGGLIRPSDDITRAEASTVVLRLLQKAGLVDIRTLS